MRKSYITLETGVTNWCKHVSDVLHKPFVECGNSIKLRTDFEEHPVVQGEDLLIFVKIAEGWQIFDGKSDHTIGDIGLLFD